MKLATFDIFDTALLRRCGTPVAVWESLAELLYGDNTDLVQAFVAWRCRAKGDKLEDIYSIIDEAFIRFAGKKHGELIQAERDAERAMLIANPAIKSLIGQKRCDGWRIAFVSDMYLDSTFLKEILIEQGCAKEGDRIYVSCEHHARKDTGSLYDVVRRDLLPERWEHYGDNRKSDVKMARKKGIKGIHVPSGYNDVEKACAGVTPRLSALSRLYRLEHNGDPFAGFAADYVVPAYLPYVIFVLHEARRMGIRKLYFLSRDSYVLFKAAEKIVTEYDDIELHYLFVSRRSLLLPYLYGDNEKAYLAASDHHTIIRIDNVDKRLKNLGTSREELRNGYGIEFPYQKVNNAKEQADFLNKIFHSDFTPLLQQRAKERHGLLMDYFRQEGLCDGSYCAAVDVGWLGTSRLMINQLLRRSGNRDMHFFYYGVRGDVFPPSAGRYTSYFKQEELTTEATVLLEHYYSASPYPSTIGYQRNEDGKVVPQFDGGLGFHHTSASKANCDAICSFVGNIGNADEALLRQWAKTSMTGILNPHVAVDITPLVQTCDFDDNTPFVKRLNIMNLLRIVAFGGHVTGFDLGSLRLTLPQCLLPLAWRLHALTGRVHGLMYRKLSRN